MSESAKKEFRELQRIIRRKGYKIVPGSGHYKVIDPKGRKVIDENGPVILSSSPGDYRARDLAVARLIRAGVLETKDLPWKPVKAKQAGDLLLGEPDPEKEGREARREDERERERQRQKGDARTRHERTQTIRAKLEPIIARLGGWTKRGLISELADVVYYHSKGAPWGFPSIAAAKANATSLRKGGTLSDDRATCWEGLLDTLEQAEVLREAWFDMVRAARGLPSRAVPVVAQSARTVVDPEHPGRVLLAPETGELVAEMERHYGGERWSEREDAEPHPLLEMHENGGVRWPVDFTIDDLGELNRAVGFFEGLAVQLSFFDGQELVEPALEKIRALVEKVGEARFRNLAGRGQVAGVEAKGRRDA